MQDPSWGIDPDTSHPAEPDRQDAAQDPLRQLRILLRYKWQVLGTVVLCILTTLLAVFLVKPTYRGNAKLLIESRGANVVQIQEVYEPDKADYTNAYENTQIELLKSRPIAEQVFAELKLEQYKEYSLADEATTQVGLLADLQRLVEQFRDGGDSAASRREDKIDKLMRALHVEPVEKTNVVRISADSREPELSARIANAVVDAYIRYERGTRGGIADQATGWLNERLQQIKADLERSEKALQAFYDTEQLVNVGGARGLVEEEITDNARRLREARKVKTDLENVYRRIVEARGSVEKLQEIPAVQQESLVQTTKTSFLQAQSEIGTLQSRYGRNHPKMIAAQAKLDEARTAYTRQVRVAAEGIRSQYEIAQNTERSLAGIVETTREQIQGLDRKHNQLAMLQHEVDSNRKLYDTFLARTKETDVAGNLDIGKIRVVERAVAPRDPYKPRKDLWLITATMFGLFAGIGIALLRSYLDDTIKTPLDLERVAGIPALTVLPRVRKTGKRGERLIHIERDEPSAVYSEGVRTLRTSLLLSDVGKRRSRVLISSAVPNEGKTSIALNLALALGQVERVLLIDADLRKPSVGVKLGLPGTLKGTTDVLAGTAELKDCIYRYAEGKIDVLPCGTLPPNPLELLSSARFENLVKALGEHYDRVIIDSPPCQPVSDSRLLARCADAVIFLVKADATPSRMVAASVRQLRQAGAPLIGAVLNQADTRRQSGFSYGYYYYQGGYGTYKATS